MYHRFIRTGLGMAAGIAGFFCFLTVQNASAQKNPPASFHYQLQNTSFETLLRLGVDVLVIDPDDSKFTHQQIDELRKSGKIVLAYLSIGEAEAYRSYWKSSWKIGRPVFLDAENPQWHGNYKVKYWNSAWQKIMRKRISEIASLGYDGAYLDIIDAYEYYETRGRKSADRDMIAFVRTLSTAARKIDQNFLIVPQNSPELYAFKRYRAVIDGLGKESTWYENDEAFNAAETADALRYLDKAAADGKFILSIDYPTRQKNICDYYKQCAAHAFACLVSHLELNQGAPIACR